MLKKHPSSHFIAVFGGGYVRLFAYLAIKVIYDITNRDQFTQVLVVDLNVKLFLAKKNEVGKLKGVDAEVIAEACFESDIVRVLDVQLGDQKVFDFF